MQTIKWVGELLIVSAAIVGAGFAVGAGQSAYRRAFGGCTCGADCRCNPKCTGGCDQCPIIRSFDSGELPLK